MCKSFKQVLLQNFKSNFWHYQSAKIATAETLIIYEKKTPYITGEKTELHQKYLRKGKPTLSHGFFRLPSSNLMLKAP